LANILIVGACNPPTDKGRRELDLRLSTKFAILYVDYPEKNSLIEIYA
jgi:dynein heavy chain 1